MFGPVMKPPYKKGKPCTAPTPKCCIPGELRVNLAGRKGVWLSRRDILFIQYTTLHCYAIQCKLCPVNLERPSTLC